MVRMILCALLISATWCFGLEDVLPQKSWRLNWDFMSSDGDGYFNYLESRDLLENAIAALTYEEKKSTLRSEYGYRRNLTLITKFEYVSRELTGGGTSLKNDGFSRAYLGMRQAIGPSRQSIRLTAEYGLWVPVEADGGEPLPIGNESLDWQFVTGYAQDFFPTRGGFEMDFGYRIRTENPEDELFFDTVLFFQVFKLGNLRMHYHVLESLENTGRDFSILEYPDNRAAKAFEVKFTRQFGQRWIFNVGYEKVIDGRNLPDTSGWTIGFEWWR